MRTKNQSSSGRECGGDAGILARARCACRNPFPESFVMAPELGIIEGFYGPPWSWDERLRVVQTLALHDYRFYLYAPKGDAFLRRRWNEPHPPEERAALATFAQRCRAEGVRFGVGLSPF